MTRRLRIRICTAAGVEFRDGIGDPDAHDKSIRAEFCDVPCGVTVMVLP